MGTGHSFPKGSSTYSYCSIFPPFSHEETPKIIFYTPRNTHLRERLHNRKQRSRWVAHKITTVLPTARQKFPRYFWGYLETVGAFQSLYTYISPFLVWPWMGNGKQWPTNYLQNAYKLYLHFPYIWGSHNRILLEDAHRKNNIRHLNRSSTAAQASVSHSKNSLGYCLNHFQSPAHGCPACILSFFLTVRRC